MERLPYATRRRAILLNVLKFEKELHRFIKEDGERLYLNREGPDNVLQMLKNTREELRNAHPDDVLSIKNDIRLLEVCLQIQIMVNFIQAEITDIKPQLKSKGVLISQLEETYKRITDEFLDLYDLFTEFNDLYLT